MTLELNSFFFFKKRLKVLIFQNNSQNCKFFRIYDSKNWNFFYDSKNWTFWIRLTELNPFSLNMTKELDPLFLEYDAKNWTV